MVNCSSCGFDGYIDADEFLCPNCKSKNLTITAGEDISLMRLELEQLINNAKRYKHKNTKETSAKSAKANKQKRISKGI